MSAKRSQGGNLSWCEAIAKTFWPTLTVGKKNTLDTDVRKSSEIEEEKTEVQAHQQGGNDSKPNYAMYVDHGVKEINDEED